MTPGDAAVEVLAPSRLKNALLLVASLLFVAVAVGLPSERPVLMWTCAALFGACALAIAVALLPGASHLRLQHDGFETRSLYRSAFTRWDEVARFGVVRIRASCFVGYDFRSGVAPGLRRANRHLIGFEGMLPDTYGHSAEALAEKMERWRTAAGQERT